MDNQAIRRKFFPYCIRWRRENSFILLNRDYKPLGCTSSKHVDYETHYSKVKLEYSLKQMADMFSWNGRISDEGNFWLYHDGTVPTDSKRHMRSYLEKLSRLMTLRIDLGNPDYIGDTLRKTHFICCIKQMDKSHFVFLNRNYNKLGLMEFESGCEDTYDRVRIRCGIERLARGVSYNNFVDDDTVYLYHNECVPENSKANMDSYLVRLSKLMEYRSTY